MGSIFCDFDRNFELLISSVAFCWHWESMDKAEQKKQETFWPFSDARKCELENWTWNKHFILAPKMFILIYRYIYRHSMVNYQRHMITSILAIIIIIIIIIVIIVIIILYHFPAFFSHVQCVPWDQPSVHPSKRHVHLTSPNKDVERALKNQIRTSLKEAVFLIKLPVGHVTSPDVTLIHPECMYENYIYIDVTMWFSQKLQYTWTFG